MFRRDEQRPRKRRPLRLLRDEPLPPDSAPAAAPSPALPLLNRELSWLAFNERVIEEPTDDGLPPVDALARVRAAVQGMEARQIACLVNDLLPKLAAAGISILTWTDLSETQREAASVHF